MSVIQCPGSKSARASKRSRDVNVVAAVHSNGLANILIRPAHGLRPPVAAVGIYLGQKNVFNTDGCMVVRAPHRDRNPPFALKRSRDVNVVAAVHSNGLANI